MDLFLDFLKTVIPAALVLYGMYLAIKVMVSKHLLSKELDLKQKSLEITLPVRMQAFERITLFLERITLDNLLVRLNKPGMTAAILHNDILQEVRNEFNHNVAQQVYLSVNLWGKVVSAKEDLITKVNATYENTDPEATSIEYARVLLELSMTSDIDSVTLALSSLKEEMAKYYQI